VNIAGVVLAGGRSTRFGRDKALAMLHGEPLVRWSVGALSGSADVLAINGPEALCALTKLPQILDMPDMPAGPMAGILGALNWAAERECSHLLTAPCDTPFLPFDMGVKLVDGVGDGPVIAARAERAHPLCALWRIDARFALAALAGEPEQPSIRSIIATLGGRWLGFPDEAAFVNLNTSAEFEAASKRDFTVWLSRKRDRLSAPPAEEALQPHYEAAPE
jgi:molybdopterin-guanine dinucleotide biosynthesis protein A